MTVARSGGTSGRVAICAIARNEAAYLAEWAIYHRMIGFDHVLVYNHESTDATEKVLRRLRAAGIADYHNWATAAEPLWRRFARAIGFRRWASPARRHPQLRAYRDGLDRLKRRYEWILFIDIDEFLVIPGVDDIHAFLDRFEGESAIAVNWKIFGSSHLATKADGLVTARFLRCAPCGIEANRAVKPLARCAAIIDPNLHNHTFAPGVKYRLATGKRVRPRRARNIGRPSHDIIRINHYFTKSREEWAAKSARGRATKPAGHPEKHRGEETFLAHDRNEEFDDYMLKFAPELERRIAALEPASAADSGALPTSSPPSRSR